MNLFGFNKIPAISTAELKARITKGEKLFLLDVRQPEEHKEAAIDGSVLIPMGEIPARLAELESHKKEEIIVYCRSGNRSGQVCQYLNKLGYNAVNLQGGMLRW